MKFGLDHGLDVVFGSSSIVTTNHKNIKLRFYGVMRDCQARDNPGQNLGTVNQKFGQTTSS